MEGIAEQGLEQALRRRRLRGAREAKRRGGKQNAADRAARGECHDGLPAPGNNSRGAPINAALHKQLQG
jgi:hypothetical protein